MSTAQIIGKDVDYIELAFANAKRLSDDARLLAENGREYSALMLAIFAIEEFGKGLIAFWGARNKGNNRVHPSHVEKQSATLALLAAFEIKRLPKGKLADIRNSGGGFNEMGPFSSQFAFARSGFFDNLRMAATYADKDPKLPLNSNEDGVTVEMAQELLGWFDLAGSCVGDAPAMELASTIFENDLGRM